MLRVPRPIQTATVIAASASMAVSGLAHAPAAATVRHVINNYPVGAATSWFGHIGPHDRADFQTIGETFVVPRHTPVLQSFALTVLPAMSARPREERPRFRGYVYRWNPSQHHAVGPALWRSDVVRANSHRHPRVRFATGRLLLQPSRRYVFFISVSEIRHHASAMAAIGINENPSYRHGRLVDMGNGYHPRQWTHRSWHRSPGWDLGFHMVFIN